MWARGLRDMALPHILRRPSLSTARVGHAQADTALKIIPDGTGRDGITIHDPGFCERRPAHSDLSKGEGGEAIRGTQRDFRDHSTAWRTPAESCCGKDAA